MWLAEIAAYLRPHRSALVLALVQVALLSGLEILKPWPLKLVIDHVLSSQPPPVPVLDMLTPPALLAAACAALVLVYVLLGLLAVWNNVTTIGVGQRMVDTLRSDLYAHLQRLSLSFHARASVGDLIYRVTADTYSIQTLAMNGFFPIVSALLLLSGMFVVMIRLDAVLTLVALGVCPLLLGGVLAMNRRISVVAMESREKESAVYEIVQRNLCAIKVVQAFAKEEEEHRRFVAGSRASLRSTLRLYTWQTAYAAATNVLIALGTALVLWAGAHHVWSGTITVGDMVVFVSYLASLYAPINGIVQTCGLMQGAKAGVRRVFALLDAEVGLPEGQAALAEPVRGEVCFRDVEFSYDAGRPALRAVNLEARPGDCIAIVGPTGAGKSTLVSLIARFHDCTRGAVLVDGVDVRSLRLRELRRHISMVLQPPIVFPLSLHENIAYGKPGASRAEVEAAARLAQAHAFIERLPNGYDTVVGEQGATLSEGERQRVTIARALLRGSPILILDEPTSSVDAATEQAIMEGLARLIHGRTTFVIAHRLSTVRRATRIVVLRDGTIAESGSFEELIRARGFFYELYAAQFAGQDAGEASLPHVRAGSLA